MYQLPARYWRFTDAFPQPNQSIEALNFGNDQADLVIVIGHQQIAADVSKLEYPQTSAEIIPQ